MKKINGFYDSIKKNINFLHFSYKTSNICAYLSASIIGLFIVLYYFPMKSLSGALPNSAFSLDNDFLQHIIGQIYFLQQPWSGNLLVAKNLDAPNGVNIGLTDSIPLEIIFIKLLHPLFPSVHQGITIFLALCWFLQPICAVFALRSMGEKRLFTNIAVAVFAACMPTYLNRVSHTALCAHWILLLSLGCYFRSVTCINNRIYLIILSILPVLTFLIHPYLMVMVLAIQLAFPLGCLLTNKNIIKSFFCFIPNLISVLSIVIIGFILKYWGASGGGGYGLYSMNIAAPFWPVHSSLFPGASSAIVDATGGQAFEGYQYLGAGLLILMLSLLLKNKGREILKESFFKYKGLFVICAILTLISLSNKIYFFHFNLLDSNFHLPGSKQLRSSGRLFWPIAYFILLGSIAGIRKIYPRLWPVMLITCMVLQWADTNALREHFKNSQNIFLLKPTDTDRNTAEFISPFKKIEVYPRLECDMSDYDTVVKYIYLAAIKNIPVNTMYLARIPKNIKCDTNKNQPTYLNSDTLLILTGIDAQKISNDLTKNKKINCNILSGHNIACAIQKNLQ